MTDTHAGQTDRAISGIHGLDEILGGGFPRNRLYLIQGDPGVGKTTLALQFLLEGARRGERGLYITLSETRKELLSVAQSHGWSLDDIALFELSSATDGLASDSLNTLFHPSEVELNETTKALLAYAEEVQPIRVVFDSLSELRLLAQNPLRYRRQILAFKQHFAVRDCTVLFLDDRSSDSADVHLESLAHGVVAMQYLTPGYGSERRRLNVVKMRGLSFRSGYHDFKVATGGLQVYPRLVASEHYQPFDHQQVSSGVPELDTLLGGGLDRGTSTLLIGSAGTGKSTLASQYVAQAHARGECAAIYSFEEGLGTLMARADALGIDLASPARRGSLILQQVDPAELTPGEFVHNVRHAVEQQGARVVVIDSLNGYLNATPEEKFLILHLHELLAYLNQQGIISLLVVAQHGLFGNTPQAPVDVSYLADTVILLRHFEAMGAVRQAISVVKKRSGDHEHTIREYRLGPHGISVGEPLRDFHGVLTGLPEYTGSGDPLMANGKRGEQDDLHSKP